MTPKQTQNRDKYKKEKDPNDEWWVSFLDTK